MVYRASILTLFHDSAFAGGQRKNADSSGVYGRKERRGVGDEGLWPRPGLVCRRTRDKRGEANAVD
jgi:hypothetical protein